MMINKPPSQPSNPSNEQRHVLLKNALSSAGREEDFNNIIDLLSPPPDILNYSTPGSLKGTKIGIVGGGLAGMSAAFELRKLGCDITIFEARDDRIGGRVYTHYFDEDKKLYGELGAIRIPVSHETVWHYVNLFNLNTEPFVQRNPNGFLYVQNTRIRNQPGEIEKKLYPKFNLNQIERNTPWSELYDYAFNTPLKKLHPSIRTEILKVLPIYNPEYVPLLNISLRQNFEFLGLSSGAIELITSIDPFLSSLIDLSFNQYLSQNYPVNLAYVYRISGGLVNLPLAFYKSLSSETPTEYTNLEVNNLGNIKWKLGYWVSGIYKSQDSNEVILKYKDKSITESSYEAFNYVVCAIPFSTLRTVEINPVFSNEKMQIIRELNYVDSQRTLYLCNKRFWEEDADYGRINGGISYTDLSIANILYPSDHMNNGNPNEPGVLIASYNQGRDATYLGNTSPAVHNEIVKRQVERVHGLPNKYLDSIVQDYKYLTWNDEEWSRGCVCKFTPEQKRIFSNTLIKPEYNNSIFFAGEHISATHSWMQGSLYTGMIAANKIAQNYNVRKNK